ncbi:DivIVA domain-containing protein [Priestia aryabhattai]
MANRQIRRNNKPISEEILSQEFEEIKVPFTQKRLYNADAVDHFLTQISSDVEHLEKTSKQLLQFYENNKNGRVAETTASSTQPKAEENELEMMQRLKSKDQRMERMQKQISELFEGAVTKAEGIVDEAELEKEQILHEAKLEAERIINEAQKNAYEISRSAEEKIREAKLIKYEMDKRAQEIQGEIVAKANQLDEMKGSLTLMSQKLRGLVENTSA